jgi:hypothetical protein
METVLGTCFTGCVASKRAAKLKNETTSRRFDDFLFVTLTILNKHIFKV